jgi:hypothetical protein
MANTLYPKWKEAVINGGSNVALSGTVKAALVDTGTTAYSSAHDFYDDISSAVVGTPQTIANKTYTNGLFDGDNVTFTALAGATAEAIVIYIDTGSAATSRLVAFLDTGVTGLPLTPSGGDVTITWNASGIFQL